MTKIYLYCLPGSALGWGDNDVVGCAVGEDGQGLGQHLSSGKSWSQHDMGFTSDRKHSIYSKAYPDGYELEWVDDPENHTGLKAALELNKCTNPFRGVSEIEGRAGKGVKDDHN